ncbi:Outer membrane protein assembly factor BamB, contains PQQ-like beta-propeller repeat [Fodinibius roseus]|uniref:Outer membrane protein assembly factor BamB, contains PQQ-like beta-propeller repeat n=1 Tax=Fodinibius roseus TaxID=1194090 RepID=A0A1M4YD82_9BACT|nr:PQQ-binding-like beta-propeller repeat protein [Fodinibius roseus]SHF03568.1 Outer membrane protein assembly factor BamB, contains PQQ-like beta-propeller repeat [Fodinibius roseus]
MNKLKYSALLLLGIITSVSCSSVSNDPWTQAIPQDAPFVIIPGEETTLRAILDSQQALFLDDITSSAIQLLSEVDSTAGTSAALHGIILYPGTGNKLQAIWMADAPPEYLDLLEKQYYQEFAQNEYFFRDTEIQKLQLQNRNLFAAQLSDMLIISESSLAVEEAIRAYTGEGPRANIDNLQLEAGHIMMNTPSLDQALRQLAQVTYHPAIKDAFTGTEPALLSLSGEGEGQNREFRFSGTIPLNNEEKSVLVEAVSSENAPITLDRYISSSAAAFGLFRKTPPAELPPSLSDTTRVDSMLIDQQDRYTAISQHLDKEFALVTYAESGFLATGEHLFLRKLANPQAFKKELDQLVNGQSIELQEETYIIQSRGLAQLIGSPLSSFSSFYLKITNDVAALSQRRGLAEIIESDSERRRTMYYERSFRDVKAGLPEQVSSLLVTNSDFGSFIQSFLYPESYANTLLSRFDFLTAHTALDENKEHLQFQLNTHRTEGRTDPYIENWHLSLLNDLSGPPALANIGGSSRQEIIFATNAGVVHALAADGSTVFEVETDGDQPVGSPVVYDWYGTDQNVILLAAGDKIYGWNEQGELLPQFPFTLDEAITTPLLVSDIDGDGLPNALVATDNRELHALNERGQNIDGWPVTTNTRISGKPTVGEFRRSKTVMAFSENATHAWRSDGTSQAGFPIFVDAPLTGSPILYEEKILGNAADGNLYAIGPDQLFADSLDVSPSSSTDHEAIYVSSNSLVGSPVIETLRVQSEGRTYDESMIVTMDANGSFFVFTMDGQLLLNRNMSQPADDSFTPLITDLNRDDQKEILTLANYARLYAWRSSNGERLHIVPSAGMQYPIVADIDEDGYSELIAQTDEGMQCWTIYGQ